MERAVFGAHFLGWLFALPISVYIGHFVTKKTKVRLPLWVGLASLVVYLVIYISLLMLQGEKFNLLLVMWVAPLVGFVFGICVVSDIERFKNRK